MNRHILGAALAVALAATHAAAQVNPADLRAISPGTRIRVSAVAAEDREASRDANARRWRVGVLHEVTDDGLVLQTSASNPDALVTLPFGVIQDVQVSRGKLDVPAGVRRGVLQGTAGGALAGGVFAGLKQLLSDCGDNVACDDQSAVLSTSTGSIFRDIGVGAAFGAVAGFFVGAQSREVWEPATRHVTVGAAPRGGTRVGLAIRF
ncbi:MAG TPA: hypothetical protein VF541_20620 [Longimicrobium sp.]